MRLALTPLLLLPLLACDPAAAPPRPAAAPTPAAPAPAKPEPSAIELRDQADVAYNANEWARCAELSARAAQATKDMPWVVIEDLYNSACCHARAGDPARAFERLDAAAGLGLKRPERLLQDADLKALRDDPRWAATLARVQKNADEYMAGASAELRKIYEEDQADRRPGPNGIDWKVVAPRDAARLARVREMVKAGAPKVAADFLNAAMVFQHSDQPDDIQTAHDLAARAADLRPSDGFARWLAAAAEDRWLMYNKKPQRYGTQFKKEDGKWVLYTVDPSVTDEERAKWNVPPIAAARRQADALNAPGH